MQYVEPPSISTGKLVPILIVEDDQDYGNSLRHLLESKGFQVALAFDANSATRLLLDSTARIALIDVRLGKTLGTDLIEELKQLRPGILCISMTAFASVESVEAALHKGAYAFLRKPFHEDELSATLARCQERIALEQAQLTTARELRDSELRYRALVDSSAQGLAIVQEGRIRFANHSLANIYGFSTALELDGRYLEALQLDLASPLEGPQRIKRPDGTEGWIEHSTQALKWDEKPATMMTITDVTERVLAEETRRSLEAQLHRVQRMEALGTLAGGIAHDFNNILSAIIGNTELTMAELPAGSQGQENLERVLSAGERAKELVQQILAFGGRNETTDSVVRVADVVREVLGLLRSSLPASIQLLEDLPQEELSANINPTQLHQVLINLCTNAEFAMRKSGGELKISLDQVQADEELSSSFPNLAAGPWVRLTVQDSGQGIAPEDLERVFEPFFSTKETGVGWGMGLSAVHGIVTGYQGAVRVTSTLNVGSCFEVYLPQVLQDPELPGEKSGQELRKGTGQILLVDDEPMLISMISNCLEKLGYGVESFEDSEQALELFRSKPEDFDLILSDQTMPGMTGDVLAQRAREIRPDIPIILITGFSHVLDEETARKLNINGFLMKPFRFKALSDLVHRVLAE